MNSCRRGSLDNLTRFFIQSCSFFIPFYCLVTPAYFKEISELMEDVKLRTVDYLALHFTSSQQTQGFEHEQPIVIFLIASNLCLRMEAMQSAFMMDWAYKISKLINQASHMYIMHNHKNSSRCRW